MTRRKQIFEYIKWFLDEHNYSPTVREIGDAVGLRSSSTVHRHLEILKKDGYIDYVPTFSRTIIVLDHEWRGKGEQAFKAAR